MLTHYIAFKPLKRNILHNNEMTISMHHDYHPGFVFFKGTVSILVSASHAVVHEHCDVLIGVPGRIVSSRDFSILVIMLRIIINH